MTSASQQRLQCIPSRRGWQHSLDVSCHPFCSFKGHAPTITLDVTLSTTLVASRNLIGALTLKLSHDNHTCTRTRRNQTTRRKHGSVGGCIFCKTKTKQLHTHALNQAKPAVPPALNKGCYEWNGQEFLGSGFLGLSWKDTLQGPETRSGWTATYNAKSPGLGVLLALPHTGSPMYVCMHACT